MNLRRFASLYSSGKPAASAFRGYLSLPADHVVPLSLSHGVDFGHEALPQNILGPEPIHWAYNEEIFERSRKVKPALRIPHPFMLLHGHKRVAGEKSQGSLLIGPPPSLTNDVRLSAALQRNGISATHVLLKARGQEPFDASREYWLTQGLTPVTAGPADEGHLYRLGNILTSFESVVAPIFSSVIVFALAIGCRVIPVRSYAYCSYSPKIVDFSQFCSAPSVQVLGRLLEGGDQSEAVAYARSYLGQGFIQDADQVRAEFLRLISGSKSALFMPAYEDSSRLTRRFMRGLAKFLNRADFLRYGVSNGITFKFLGLRTHAVCKEIDIFDAIKNGVSSSNFRQRDLKDHERFIRTGQGADSWSAAPLPSTLN